VNTNVINLFEIKYKSILNFNLSSDIIYITKNKHNIRQQMVKGYIELLTNQINK
jgi:hypothetical protein